MLFVLFDIHTTVVVVGVELGSCLEPRWESNCLFLQSLSALSNLMLDSICEYAPTLPYPTRVDELRTVMKRDTPPP